MKYNITKVTYVNYAFYYEGFELWCIC